MQISVVSSGGMLVKSESTCKIPIDNTGSCSKISSAKWNESFTVYSFLVKEFDWENKHLVRLYMGIVIVPGLVTTGFINFFWRPVRIKQVLKGGVYALFLIPHKI